MSTLNNIKTELEDGILIATISRPKSLNALNIQTMDEIRSLAREIYDNDDIKGVIITGDGEKSFVAGADITEIAGLDEMTARKFSENGQETFSMLENSPKPIIAAVNGFALGGGCELAMACHVRIASENAKFGLPEVNLGVIPGYGGTQRLAQLVGKGRAFEMTLTGDMISADEAYRIGLVNKVTSNQEELMELSKKMLAKMLAKAPLAVGMAINCINDVYNQTDGFQTEANAFAHCTKTEDFEEGTTAFLEKRKPEFKGE